MHIGTSQQDRFADAALWRQDKRSPCDCERRMSDRFAAIYGVRA